MYEQNEEKDRLNWNNIFKLGIEIKKSFSLNEELIGENKLIKEELEYVSSEIFNNLKGINLYLSIFIFLCES
jgi:hypothetical protein